MKKFIITALISFLFLSLYGQDIETIVEINITYENQGTYLGTTDIILRNQDGDKLYFETNSSGSKMIILPSAGSYEMMLSHSDRDYQCRVENFSIEAGQQLDFSIELIYNPSRVIHVSNNRESIQEAVNQAANGSTVVIEAGTYSESNVSWHDKHITVTTNTQNPAVLRGQTFVLDDPTINNQDVISEFLFTGQDVQVNVGGAMALLNGASPIVRNCVFQNKWVFGNLNSNLAGAGGAIFIQGSSLQTNIPIIENCDFNYNSAAEGSGGGAIALFGAAKIISCNFYGNLTQMCVGKSFDDTTREIPLHEIDFPPTNRVGGAILIHIADEMYSTNDLQEIIIDGCTFSDNASMSGNSNIISNDNDNGNTIHVQDLNMISSLTIQNCQFNASVNYGGSVLYLINKSEYTGNGNETVFNILNNKFINPEDDVPLADIILFNDFGLVEQMNVKNNIFENIWGYGFRLSYHGSYPTYPNYLNIDNNTFSSIDGIAIELINGADYVINNNIFMTCEMGIDWNSGSQYSTESLELNNNLFYDNETDIDFIGSVQHPLTQNNNMFDTNPLLDSNYRPIWTLAQQSPCIEAGVRDLDGDGAWWFEDKDDQDIYGTRPEIGAIPADMDGWGHVLPANQVRWICFPYTLNDPSRYELTHYLEGAQVNFINHDYTNNPGTSPNTPVFGQKGFKIKALRNEKIDHFGKPVGHPLHYPSGNQIILSRLPFAESGTNLIGYYKENSCNPMDAFQGLLDSGMIESVKAEDWTIYYGYPQNPKGDINEIGWHLISHTGKKPSLDLGEAVEVIYCGEANYIEFNWSNGIPIVPMVKSTKPSTFAYEEKENYLPMQVKIAELNTGKSEELSGELGVYINGECKGAGIISDSLVTVFAYLDSLVLTENDTISFVIHDYHDSKSVKKIQDYQIYDSNSDSYVAQITHKITDTIVFFNLTSKDDQQNNTLPVITEIKSIYPNPFNPETTIEFNLKENSDVNIRVYNLKGQLVKTVINSKFEAGNHKVIWNGTNSNEQRVASGLYFCRMETKDKSVTKKMILMK